MDFGWNSAALNPFFLRGDGMDRQGVLFCAAILLAISGAGLFGAATHLERQASEEAQVQAARDIRSSVLGIYLMTVNEQTGFTTISLDGRDLASFPNATKLMPASMSHAVAGVFLAQSEGGGDEGTTCEVWRLDVSGPALRKEAWRGECRADEDPFADHFWLSYAPRGTSERLSVPVSYDVDDSGKHAIAWGDASDEETFHSRYGHQAERLMQDIQNLCETGVEAECRSVLKALAFMVASASGAKEAHAFADQVSSYAKPAGDYVRGILDDVQAEVEALRKP